MRRIGFYASLLVCVLLSAPGLPGEKVATMPTPAGYVDDYAGVLSDSSRAEMEALCRQVHDRTKAQIFVVTVHTLEGEEIAPFANDLFHQWKIGEKKTDRGLLLLFAIDDHKRRIEVGYGLEGILNDAKVGDIGREMVPELRAENYGGAIELGVEEVAKVIAVDAGVTLDLPSEQMDRPVEEMRPAAVPPAAGTDYSFLIPVLLFGGLFGLVLWVAIRNARRNGFHMGAGSDSSHDSSSFSSSDSSSSDSFSGGDGGDSGGGGADGSW